MLAQPNPVALDKLELADPTAASNGTAKLSAAAAAGGGSGGLHHKGAPKWVEPSTPMTEWGVAEAQQWLTGQCRSRSPLIAHSTLAAA
jgi:hypothetical protein